MDRRDWLVVGTGLLFGFLPFFLAKMGTPPNWGFFFSFFLKERGGAPGPPPPPFWSINRGGPRGVWGGVFFFFFWASGVRGGGGGGGLSGVFLRYFYDDRSTGIPGLPAENAA